MPKIDWRSPESEDQKQKMIGKSWGDYFSTCLWYEIGEINDLNEEEVETIVKHLFGDEVIGFAEIKLYESDILPGKMLLRFRGRLHLRPSLSIRGRYCPLYKVGPGGGHDINFHERWG